MMRRPVAFAVPVLACALALAACGGDNGGKGKGRDASAEVLEGTISDGMIPLDELRSESPLAPPEPAKGAGGKRDAGESAGEGAAAPTEQAGATGTTPAPAAPTIPATPDPIGAVVQEKAGQ